MKGKRRNRLINLIGFGAAVGLLVLIGSSCFAQYQVTSIEPLSSYERSRAMGINYRGEVVGRFYRVTNDEAYDRQAFIWNKYNGSRSLPTLSGESSAWGVNDNGLVSGYSFDANGHQSAVLWDSRSSSVEDLKTLPNTTTTVRGNESTAYDLNNLGQVVGYAEIPDDHGTFMPFHAILHKDGAEIQDLRTFTSAAPTYQNGYSIAYDVNDNGQVVGLAHDASWALLPFIYDETNGMHALTRHASHLGGEWYAVAISDAGVIGGHVITGTNRSIPHYWQNESAQPVALNMPAGFPYGEIYSISASGQMVGMMWDTDQDNATVHGFVFDAINRVRDLNDLTDPSCQCTLYFARDINDRGQIVGYGEKNGNMRGILLDPPDLPPSDFDGDGVVDGVDNCTLVSNPGQRDTNNDGCGNACDPDLDNNGTVNAFDMQFFSAMLGQSGDLDEDLNGDGRVNAFDMQNFSALLGQSPGPSGVTNDCSVP